MNKIIASSIKEYRRLRKMTQQELADSIDRELRTIQRYESGDVDFSVSTLVRIADVLNVTIYNLFGNDYIFNNANTFTLDQIEEYKHILRLERIKKYPGKLLNELISLDKRFEE